MKKAKLFKIEPYRMFVKVEHSMSSAGWHRCYGCDSAYLPVWLGAKLYPAQWCGRYKRKASCKKARRK